MLEPTVLIVDAVVSQDIMIDGYAAHEGAATHSLAHVLLLGAHAPTRDGESLDLSVDTFDAVLVDVLDDAFEQFFHFVAFGDFLGRVLQAGLALVQVDGGEVEGLDGLHVVQRDVGLLVGVEGLPGGSKADLEGLRLSLALAHPFESLVPVEGDLHIADELVKSHLVVEGLREVSGHQRFRRLWPGDGRARLVGRPHYFCRHVRCFFMYNCLVFLNHDVFLVVGTEEDVDVKGLVLHVVVDCGVADVVDLRDLDSVKGRRLFFAGPALLRLQYRPLHALDGDHVESRGTRGALLASGDVVPVIRGRRLLGQRVLLSSRPCRRIPRSVSALPVVLSSLDSAFDDGPSRLVAARIHILPVF